MPVSFPTQLLLSVRTAFTHPAIRIISYKNYIVVEMHDWDACKHVHGTNAKIINTINWRKNE